MPVLCERRLSLGSLRASCLPECIMQLPVQCDEDEDVRRLKPV